MYLYVVYVFNFLAFQLDGLNQTNYQYVHLRYMELIICIFNITLLLSLD